MGVIFFLFWSFLPLPHIGAFFKEGEKKGMHGGWAEFFLLSIKNSSLRARKELRDTKGSFEEFSASFFPPYTTTLACFFLSFHTHTKIPKYLPSPCFSSVQTMQKKELDTPVLPHPLKQT
jgi:hypothetical protein